MQQASVEKFSDLIGGIYDCVIAPERWAGTLDEICTEFGFATGALSVASLTNMKAVVNAVSGSDLSQMSRNAIGYGPDIIELWGGAERIQQYPLGEPIVQSQAVRQDIISSNRYYREWAMPKGLFDAVAVGLVRDRTMVGNAIFSQHEFAGPIDDTQLSGLRLLAPHIRRAVTISNLFDMKTVEAATFAATVDALTVGVVLVDGDSKIVHANAAATAMLEAGDPIVERHGRIAVQSATTTTSLQSAIAQAAKDEAALGQKGIGIPILRGSGDPHVIHVLPLATRPHARRPDPARCRRPVRGVSLRTAADASRRSQPALRSDAGRDSDIRAHLRGTYPRRDLGAARRVRRHREEPSAACVREDRLPPPGRSGQAGEVADVSGVRRGVR